MAPRSPQMRSELKFKHEQSTKPDGSHLNRSSLSIDTEDIIAIGAIVVAVAISVAMIFGALPVNALTVGLAAFSGAGAAVAKIVKAKRSGA